MPTLKLHGEQFHYHVDDYSDPWRSAEPMLLHHSAGGNLHRWRPWVPTLARRHPTLRFDMRGHAGTTSRSASPFVITELAADIARVMDALEVDKSHLVGASAGGIVSLQFAHDFPDRLHSLTLVASTPRLAQMGADMDASGWGDTLRAEGTRAWLLSDTDKRFGPDTPRDVIDWYADEGAKTEASQVLALQACLLAADLAPAAAADYRTHADPRCPPRPDNPAGSPAADGPNDAQRRAGGIRRRGPQHEGGNPRNPRPTHPQLHRNRQCLELMLADLVMVACLFAWFSPANRPVFRHPNVWLTSERPDSNLPRQSACG